MKLKLVSLVLVLLASVRCGAPAPPTVEGKVAQGGRQVIAAAESVLSGVDQLVTTNVLSKEDATRVVTVIKKVGVEGERLSQILTVVDQSRDEIERQKGLAQAAEILKAINRLVIEAGSGIGSDDSRAKVLALLAQITDVVVNIALLFPNVTV